MGCCQTHPFSLSEDTFLIQLKHSLTTNNLPRFKYLLHQKFSLKSDPIDVNYFTFKANPKMTLNLPCLCILEGSFEIFKYIHKTFPILIQQIENLFTHYKLSGISVLCAKGYSEFLEYYLPLALSTNVKVNDTVENISICFDEEQNLQELTTGYTPVQLACFFGHINCVKVLSHYFKSEKPPCWLDVNYQDPQYGENCALIACKAGNYVMIKYLLTNGCDFKVVNERNENALQVFLVACKNRNVCEKLNVVKYLVEKAGVDVRHEIEETLLVCEFADVVEYIEKKAEEFGVFVRKNEIEKGNEIEFSISAKNSCAFVFGQNVISSGLFRE